MFISIIQSCPGERHRQYYAAGVAGWQETVCRQMWWMSHIDSTGKVQFKTMGILVGHHAGQGKNQSGRTGTYFKVFEKGVITVFFQWDFEAKMTYHLRVSPPGQRIFT